MFKSEKYSSNYIGFAGHDLTPFGIVENANALSAAFALSSDSFSLDYFTVQNPVRSGHIQFSQSIDLDAITIYDVNGRLVYSQTGFNSDALDVQLQPAVYFMKLTNGTSAKTIKIIVQ